MKESYWGYWLMVFGVFIIVVLLLIQSFTSTNTQDYYLIKEISEAAMVDAIDYGYYRTYGELKMNKEKFYEVFLRRFAEEASLTTNYTIEFTEIYEAPPKIGVKVSSKSASFQVAGDTTTFDIVNKVDAILESKVDPVNKTSVSEEGIVKKPGLSNNQNNSGNSGSSGNSSNPETPSEDNKEKSTVNNFGAVTINQSQETINVNGTTVYMDCACGPIAMTEAIMMLGKGDSLKSNIQSELGYTPNNATETAAASYVLMYKKGLNGNPSSHDFSSSNFCGGKGNYKSNGNSFLNNYGLKVDDGNSGGTLNGTSAGYAEKIYKSLKAGNVVIASISYKVGSNIPSNTGLASTSTGHYYTIYGYNATDNCFNVYNPITYYKKGTPTGTQCVPYDAVDKYFTEYISVGN